MLSTTHLNGKTFNYLTVLEFSHKNCRGQIFWKCQCICDRIVYKCTANIVNGYVKSCGCKRFGPKPSSFIPIGTKIHYLTVTGTYWHCKTSQTIIAYICVCGAKGYLCSKRKNKNKSCGCQGKSYKGISGQHWCGIKYSAKKRNIEFNITKEYVWDLFIKQKAKCALSGIKLKIARNDKINTASLDRIDSSKGYIEGNVQWVHKDVNMMKWAKTDKQLIKWCDLISQYNKGKFI